MPGVSRIEFLARAGKLAWKGLVAAVAGVEIVVDPNEPPPEASQTPAAAEGAADSPSAAAEPVAPGPEDVGTPIGRKALAAAQHRMESAVLAPRGREPAVADPLEGAPLTLALFPGAGPGLVKAALGLEGEELSLGGDMELHATRHDLAWLPLEIGMRFYEPMGGGRLLAVGGYRRASLVRFGEAAPGADVWCALGDDELFRHLPAQWRSRLLLEHEEALWRAIERQRARLALLGGEALERALSRPDATVEVELTAGASFPWVPVWGLFSPGRGPEVTAFEQEHLVMVPAAELPELQDLLEAVAS